MNQKEGHSWVIETTTGHAIKASVLIDATGKRSWLARQLGLVAETTKEVSHVQFGWSSSRDCPSDDNPVSTQTADGWDWLAPVDLNTIAWVKLRTGDHHKGVDFTPRIFRQCAGSGWFLVGDAACLSTPASGNEVLRAIMSGMFAAHLTSLIANAGISSQNGANGYRLWIGGFWEHSVAARPFSLNKTPHGKPLDEPLASFTSG